MRRLVAVISAIVFLDAMLFGALIPLVPGVRRRLRPQQAPGRAARRSLRGRRRPRRDSRRHRRRPRRAEERRHQRAPAARVRDLRAGARRLPGNRRHRPLPPGPLERAHLGRSALLGDRVHAARASRPAPRHGLRDRRPRRDPRADGRSGREARRVPGRLHRHRRDRACSSRSRHSCSHGPGSSTSSAGAVRRAFADPAFVAGLWLNALPALFFGVLDVLAPLALDAGGYGVVAIGAVFLVAGPDRDRAEPAARAALRPPRTAPPDPLGALRVDRRRGPARRSPRRRAVDRRARGRRSAVVRRLLHAGDRPRLRPRRDRRARAGAGVRRHEHRLGGRGARRADARRRARRPARRCCAVPPLLVPLRGHARDDHRARAVTAASPTG